MELEDAAFTGDRISRRSLRRLMRSPTAHLAVADGGKPLGYALTLFRASSTAARLYSLAVRADRRGEGVGRDLLMDAIAVARQRGCWRLDLEVRADNAAALRLYCERGFLPVRTLPAYYDDGAPGERLSLALEPLS